MTPHRRTEAELFRHFVRYAEMHLGRRVDDDVLHAAAAVRLRAKRASSKLSPVAHGPKTEGARRSITACQVHGSQASAAEDDRSSARDRREEAASRVLT